MEFLEPETIANQSPASDHAHARSGSSINQIRIGERGKGYLLALSIVVNILCGWVIYQHAMEKRLQQYDLDWFKSSDFSQLKGQVEMHDKMLNMLIVRKECLK